MLARPMFLAIFESVMLANGLSAPQHSTYLVILEEGRVRTSGPPGVATIGDRRQSMLEMDILRMSPKIEPDDLRRSANAIKPWTESLRLPTRSGRCPLVVIGSTGSVRQDFFLDSPSSLSSSACPSSLSTVSSLMVGGLICSWLVVWRGLRPPGPGDGGGGIKPWPPPEP
uniref:Putative secreted protein n=1 Tax=Anopheles darlingi TaxID=43151 RepID=A0A2M4DEB8_ANODA